MIRNTTVAFQSTVERLASDNVQRTSFTDGKLVAHHHSTQHSQVESRVVLSVKPSFCGVVDCLRNALEIDGQTAKSSNTRVLLEVPFI